FYTWKAGSEGISTAKTFDYEKVDLRNGDTVSVEVMAVNACDTLYAYDTLIVKQGAPAYEPFFLALTRDSVAQCEYEGYTVTAHAYNLEKVADGTLTASDLRYSWYKNGKLVKGNTPDSTYYFDSLKNGDYVHVEAVLPDNACALYGGNNPTLSHRMYFSLKENRKLEFAMSLARAKDTAVCPSTAVTFNTKVVNGGGYTIDWYVDGSLTAAGDSYTYTPDSTVEVYAVVHANNPGYCLDTVDKMSDTVMVQLLAAPEVRAWADTEVYAGSKVMIHGELLSEADQPTTVLWTSTQGQVPGNSQLHTEVTVNTTTFYYLTAYSAYGCKSNTDTVEVDVFECPTLRNYNVPSMVCDGDSALLRVDMAGYKPSSNLYKWQISTDGGNKWTDVSGSRYTVSKDRTGSTLKIKPANFDLDASNNIRFRAAVSADTSRPNFC
ncbi:MAG: hypothetical protein K2I83_03310, partial [Bacteroidales bacterium]|nr:hypothetical protein [Bacteroidales bacterium]